MVRNRCDLWSVILVLGDWKCERWNDGVRGTDSWRGLPFPFINSWIPTTNPHANQIVKLLPFEDHMMDSQSNSVLNQLFIRHFLPLPSTTSNLHQQFTSKRLINKRWNPFHVCPQESTNQRPRKSQKLELSGIIQEIEIKTLKQIAPIPN